jgi:hypothetical protein
LGQGGRGVTAVAGSRGRGNGMGGLAGGWAVDLPAVAIACRPGLAQYAIGLVSAGSGTRSQPATHL